MVVDQTENVQGDSEYMDELNHARVWNSYMDESEQLSENRRDTSAAKYAFKTSMKLKSEQNRAFRKGELLENVQ